MSFASLLNESSNTQGHHLNGHSELAKDQLKCSTCGAHSRDLHELETHITVDHLDWVPFLCFYCQFVHLPTEYTLRAHLKEQHPNREPMLVHKINDAKREQLSNLIAKSLDLRNQANESRKDSDSGRPMTTCKSTAAVDDRDRFSAIRVISTDSSRSAALLPFSPSIFDKLDANRRSSIQQSHEPDSSGLAPPSESSRSRAQSVASPTTCSAFVPPIEIKTEPIDSINRSGPPQVQLSQSTTTGNERDQSADTNKGKGSICAICGEKISCANEQRDHVLRKHMEKRLMCCKSCDYKTNVYNNAYMHASSTHKLRKNRVQIFADLRLQYAQETTSLIKSCFPDGNGIRPQYRRSADSASKQKSRSRMSLPAASVLNASTDKSRSNSTVPRRPKSTFSTVMFVCAECSSRIRGNSYSLFEQHAMLHFHAKRYQCKECSFATNRKNQADYHSAEEVHELSNRRLKLHEELQKTVLRCFPKLSEMTGSYQK